MKVALVTNMPAPYRVPMWNLLGDRLGENFLVLFCAAREPNRQWNVPPMRFRHVFLKERYHEKAPGIYVHNNPDVRRHLRSFRPDVVITGGFNPTMLYAFLYALVRRKKHIPVSDAWAWAERHLTPLHRAVRNFVYRFSHAFLACSEKGRDYFASYGLKTSSIFISHYTVSDGTLPALAEHGRHFDLLFSGQFTERKNPVFFTEVARTLAQRGRKLRVLLLGDGPLRETMLERLREANIDFHYAGYARQEDLPGFYASSRLFLFPTQYDAWGVVAQEAMLAGTPVCTTPYAGCSEELVLPDVNGFVLPLDAAAWADRCERLLSETQTWERFSQAARQAAASLTHARAADALMAACAYAGGKL